MTGGDGKAAEAAGWVNEMRADIADVLAAIDDGQVVSNATLSRLVDRWQWLDRRLSGGGPLPTQWADIVNPAVDPRALVDAQRAAQAAQGFMDADTDHSAYCVVPNHTIKRFISAVQRMTPKRSYTEHSPGTYVLDFTAAHGVPFRVVGYLPGVAGPYPAARNDHEKLVEFYDARHPHTEHGQFVNRYYVDTLLGRRDFDCPLDLNGGEPEWVVDVMTMIERVEPFLRWLDQLATATTQSKG